MAKHFKGLDTLRAVAALVVVLGHIELLKKINFIPNLIDNDFFIFPSRHLAVILFFVLSGFLITYTLVKEREYSEKIHLKNFYLRRILRIWPLYFTTIFLSYILFDFEYSTKTILLCLTIFPNIAHAFEESWVGSPQIWSIGVEEQFYLIWPIALMLLPEKKITKSLIFFIIAYTILPQIIQLFHFKVFLGEDIIQVLNNLIYLSSFNCMALGALMGYALAKEKKWIKIFSHQYVVISAILTSFGLWFFKFEFSHFNYLLYALLFSFMIIGLASSKKNFIETQLTRFLGKISYGIYMYHWIVIVIAMKYIKFDGNQLNYNCMLYVTVFGSTILISWISHQTLERIFLNFKKNFQTKQL